MTESLADDLRLVEQLCHGDAQAAREIYRRHGTALLRFALAMSRNRQTAEDLVHDTFVEFLHDPRRFDPARGSVAAYLYGIARHQMSRHVRRLDAESLSGACASEEGARDAGAAQSDFVGADERLDRDRAIDRVRRAVFDLPFVQREVIALCDLEELPYATVAAILDCPIGTVRSRLHRARALLAERLDPIERGTGASQASGDGRAQAHTDGHRADRHPDDQTGNVSFACRNGST